ncbi:MAG: protocatechuate 3,4-dioxygenase [Verrucomicrobiota bacterium]
MKHSMIIPQIHIPSRRHFLRQMTLGAALLSARGAFAEMLLRTPAQTEGPFYPDKLPLDTDNDLIVVNNNLTPAVGEITWLSGKILDLRGDPIRNAMVEIWQCDHNGVYIHTRDSSDNTKQDKNFQGYGRFLTGSTGEYLFRTIKPVPYSGRTAHIHFKVRRGGKELLTTQCFIKGYAGNEKDGIWKSIRDEKERNSVTVDFNPLKNSAANELAARFDIVLGVTPTS